MLKKIAAVAGGVLIGLAIAFARAGAFPFWGSDSDTSKAPPPAQQAQANPAEPLPAPPVPGVHVAPAVQPAEPNTPEPGEKVGVITLVRAAGQEDDPGGGERQGRSGCEGFGNAVRRWTGRTRR